MNKKFLFLGIVSAISIVSVSVLTSFFYEQTNGIDEDVSITPQITPVLNQTIANKIIEECKDDVHCSVNQLSNLAKNSNQQFVLETFKELIVLYINPVYECHHINHHLGMWLYGYTQDLETSLENADPFVCGGGIYHGIFQNFFMTKHFHDVKPDVISINKLCPETDNNRFSIMRAHCVHGVGHGLTMIYDYDIVQAVNRCNEFNTKAEQQSCSTGVFMQNVNAFYENGEGNFDEDDLYFPCNKVDSSFGPPCYIWHATYILAKNDFEVYSSFRDCDQLSSEDSIKYCYYGIGRELLEDTSHKMDVALQFCQAGTNSHLHTFCLKGIASKTSMQYLENGYSFCALLPEKYKTECYDALGYWIHMRHADIHERENECSLIKDPEYYNTCMNPNLDEITLL